MATSSKKTRLNSCFNLNSSFWKNNSAFSSVSSFIKTNFGSNESTSQEYTTIEVAKIAAQFTILWYLANLFSNASLSYTSVGSSTLLTSTSSFFTLILGTFFKIEKFTLKKLVALCISIVAVALIDIEETITDNTAVPDPDSPTQNLEWLGNLMALASAFLYGVYTTFLKLKVGDDHDNGKINMFQFFGFVGIFNLLLLWPVILLFDYLNIERFQLPPTSHVWYIVLINASSTVVSDFCWALATLFTSPLVVTVGLSATIPLALAGDMILKGRHGTWIYYIGATLLCFSFFVINKEEETEEEIVEDETITEN